MLHGVIALILRYILMLGGSALVTAGIISTNGASGYCLDLSPASSQLAEHVILWGSGALAIVSAVLWRGWSKVRGGVT